MCLAVPGQIKDVYDDDGTRMGRVSFGGVVKEVCLEFVPELNVGDYTIVHVGFALGRIDEETARQTLADFEAMGVLDDEFGEESG